MTVAFERHSAERKLMNGLSSTGIPRYIMRAFERNADGGRIPGRKPRGAKTVSTARVVLSVQHDGEFSYLSFNPVDIRGDSAEWYGYEDGIPFSEAPTMLDVMTQAHEFLFGDKFNRNSCRSYLDIDEEGILRKVMGVSGLCTCFVVNNQYAYDARSEYNRWGFRGLGYREMPISDLDVIEVFGFQDSIGLDYYTYFLNPDGSVLRSVVAAPGEPITMQQEGYLFVIGGPYRHVDRIEQRMVAVIENSQIAIVNPLTFELTDIEGAVTNEKGYVTFSIDEPGGYYITAHGGRPPRYRASLSLPWLPVIIR